MQEATISGHESIDWTQSITPPRWMPHRAYVTAISQLYHGELATLAMCRDLREMAKRPADLAALETQIADEKRHIEIYRNYLDRLGDIAPPEPALEAALDGRYLWRGSHLGTIVAVHLLLEGEGLRVQNDYGRWFPCRLLRMVHGSISLDEARHVAFGRRLVAREVATVSQEERIAIYRWLEKLWCDGARVAGRPARLHPFLAWPEMDRRALGTSQKGF